MTWKNELREEIKLTSPEGNVFFALWRNNERSFDKKLGMFDPPRFDGTIVQDLGSGSMQYTLTIYFEGAFHNTEAERFMTALKEVGQWEIIHPVKGPLILQLIGTSENMAPTENGNYTEFETNWLVPANIERIISSSELGTSILTTALNAFDDALTMLTQLRSDAYSLIQSSINTFNKITGIMDVIIQQLAVTDSLAQESYESARTAFTSAISLFSIENSDPEDVGNAQIDMALAPIESNSDFSDRFSIYNAMLEDLYTITPETTTPDDKNKLIAQEFGIIIALIVIAEIVASSEFTNRSEIISAIENLFDAFNNSIAVIEESQNNFASKDIDFQYFSQTTTYTSLMNLYTLVLEYLLSQFFSLNAEKRFILKNPRSPLEITITEYGELGEDDENYDLFLTSNQLSGNDILILPAGREVVIYA